MPQGPDLLCTAVDGRPIAATQPRRLPVRGPRIAPRPACAFPPSLRHTPAVGEPGRPASHAAAPRTGGVGSVVLKLDGKVLNLFCRDRVALRKKNTVYGGDITRLSTHHTIPKSQEISDQKNNGKLKWNILSQQKFFKKVNNEHETTTKVSF